jgi:hypothetical protein
MRRAHLIENVVDRHPILACGELRPVVRQQKHVRLEVASVLAHAVPVTSISVPGDQERALGDFNTND